MRILGQGVKDLGERFFHGMYVSAQGNPVYTGTPVPTEGVQPDSVFMQTGIIEIGIFLAFMLAAVLTLFAMYHIQQRRILGVNVTQTS